jgi:hypothetical protein
MGMKPSGGYALIDYSWDARPIATALVHRVLEALPQT